MEEVTRNLTLAGLFPPGVAVATETDPDAAWPLFPCEESAIRNAVASRRREFALGRTCARRALQTLGAVPAPVCVGEMREPIWPDGFVGSITHCGSFCAAAVAPRSALCGLGLDAAHNHPLGRAVRDLIVASPAEEAWAVRTDANVSWDAMLFSAKEAVFKAWWPARREWLDFADVRIRFDEVAGAFTADITLGQPLVQAVDGRFTTDDNFVITATWLRAKSRRRQ